MENGLVCPARIASDGAHNMSRKVRRAGLVVGLNLVCGTLAMAQGFGNPDEYDSSGSAGPETIGSGGEEGR